MKHEMTLHPDESVFYSSASSVFKNDYSFKSAKDYPGGAFVFQMPFQFVGKIEAAMSPGGLGERDWGRIASIFYFSTACFIGGIILYRNFGKRILAVFFYALIMVFSLFQIELSRYGTGDAISFFVLMVILYLLDIFFKEEDCFYLYFAAFFTGVIAAIKFPLLFFIIYPICALLIKSKLLNSKKSLLKSISCIFIFALLGLLLFSPQWFVDKAFFMKAFFAELGPYVLGNKGFVDTPINHLAYLMIYQTLYSDFPFAVPLVVIGVITLYKQNKKHDFTNALYTLVLPVSLFFFSFYNLFATAFSFRTLYPYFSLCVFFTSFALSELFSRKKYRIAIIALSAFMVLRGSFLVYTLTEKSRGQLIIDTLTQHEAWNNRSMIVLYGNNYIAGHANIPQRKYVYDRYVYFEENPLLLPGEFGITSPTPRISIFRSGTDKEKLRAGWVAFRDQNKDYLIGVSYPPYYHYIFGAWISGSSLGSFEFPVNYIYYRNSEIANDIGNPKKYYPLYEISDWQEYLKAIANTDCTVILSSNGNLPEDFASEVFSCLSLDYDSSLIIGVFCVFIVQPSNTEPSLILNHSDEASISLALTDIIGQQSSIDVSARKNVLTVNDRTYATNTAGFNIVLYDDDLGCVMDWRSLTIDTSNGNISLKY
jgi:hypothetical protein